MEEPPRAFVPSDGPEQADLVVIGEAPGINEVSKGKPFVGDSGQLLDVVLDHFGVERKKVFVTNVCLCRPPGNTNPSAVAVRCCSNRLREEVLARRPKQIICLGNYASRAILGTDAGVTALRLGAPKTSETYPDTEIISTYHPAACLRNPFNFPDLVTDCAKLFAPTMPDWQRPEFEVIDDGQEAKRFLANLLISNTNPIAVDIEASGTEKDGGGFEHPDKYTLIAVGICSEGTFATVLGEEALRNPDVLHLLGKLIEQKQIICHNGKFDLQALLKYGDGRLWFDTMMASYAMDERRGVHGLEYQAVERLGSPAWKHVIARYLGGSKEFGVVPRPILYQYNALDVANTYRLYEWFTANLPADLRKLHDHLVEVSYVMQYVERNGVAVDIPYLDELTFMYEDRVEELLFKLRSMCGESWYNPNSHQQVQRVFDAMSGRHVRDSRADTIEQLRENAARIGNRTLYDFCTAHLQFKKEVKSYGTYVKGTRKRLIGGRVYPSYLLHGTTNGRSSCRNPNLQNVTRGDVLRKLFVPGSDQTTFMQADYRQAELRVICTLARDAYLRGVFFDRHRNLHEEVGRIYYGPGFTKHDKERYIRTKAIVFGLSYGREAFSIAMEHGMSLDEAKAQVAAFFERIPGVVAWREQVREQIFGLEDLISPFGQHRRFSLITARNKKDVLREAWSFLPQNIVSHLTFAGAVDLVKRDPRFRDMIRINVHDAWVIEVDKKDLEEAIPFVARTMEEAAVDRFTDYVPFPVDISVGPNWGSMAELVVD
jgi:uracil-DNA glycosylase family 4